MTGAIPDFLTPESKPKPKIPEGKLGEVAKAANALTSAERRVEQLTEDLKQAKRIAQNLREDVVPSMMRELGLRKLELEDGSKVLVKEEVYASIPVRHREQAHQWLREHNFEDLIKVEVRGQFGKGDYDRAQEVIDALTEAGIKADTKESVHPMTLRAWLREQLREGADIPLDIFGARPVETATVSK